MKQLEKLGIKTVVNLRSSHSDRDELQGTSLTYEHIEMTAWGKPENEDVLRFLQIVSDSNSLPVFVHCQHGADRTGTVCAIYRIMIQGWSKDEAIEEMTKGGFGYHSIWRNLPDYVRKLDIEEIKRNAGLGTPQTH
jgi:protein tyrosine/serine phosphatase